MLRLKEYEEELMAKSKELDKTITALGADPKLVSVKVTSTRRYPNGNYHWTTAYYDNSEILTYSNDPRHPGMNSQQIRLQIADELIVAKEAFVSMLAA